MANVKRVAEAAAVSVATVSRVINGSGFVSLDLKQRVYRAMEALDYRPSTLARGLRTQQTFNIGVLVPQIDHPFFGALTFALEKSLFERRYRCFVCSTEEDSEKEDIYLDALLTQHVSGLIIVPTDSAGASIQKFIAQQTPVVLVDRDLPGVTVDRILSDNAKGAYDLARYLFELGHRKVAVIGTSARSRAMTDRVAGLEQAFNTLSSSCDLQVHFQEPLTQFDAGYETGIRLLSGELKPTAIIALTDVIAVGVLHASAELGITVPDDLSVTGFDDIPLARHVLPALTTVAQPLHQIGQGAAELMLSKIAEPSKPARQMLLPTKLMVRGSTGAARQTGA